MTGALAHTPARLRSRCARCGVGGWHPEAASCPQPDCELAAREAHETGAALPPSGAAPVTPVDLEPVFHGVHHDA